MPLVDNEFKPLELPSSKHARVIFDDSKKWRYRALWGGRNGAKDWSFAAALIERCVRTSTRVLCTREIQNTLKDSIHRLLCDTIDRLGYTAYFTTPRDEIRCERSGSSIVFRGLRDLNAESVKSIEGIDVCLIGEAQSLTKQSFTVLDPSIRKPGSEIWIQFNPKYDDDFVYEFCINNPPDNLIGCEVLYTDNPWTSPEILAMAQRSQESDPHNFRNVWLGEPIGQGGRVYPQYDRDIHFIDFDRDYLSKCDVYMSIDPAEKYYPAIGWHAVTPTGVVVTVNEWPKKKDLGGLWFDDARLSKTFDMSPKQLSDIILANDLTVQHGARIVARTIDPRFAAKFPEFTRNLMEYGVNGWVEAPFEKVETQRNVLREMMRVNINIPLYGSNMPDYYVASECIQHDRALRRHRWSEDKDKEDETHKDFVDQLRYFLSIIDGKPHYIGHEKSKSHGSITSLATHTLKNMPAPGYGCLKKK